MRTVGYHNVGRGSCTFSGFSGYLPYPLYQHFFILNTQGTDSTYHFYLFGNNVGAIAAVNGSDSNHTRIFRNIKIAAYDSLQIIYDLCRHNYRINRIPWIGAMRRPSLYNYLQ